MASSSSSSSQDPVAAVQNVRTLLDARQWRKARDLAKEGCKRDRAIFLPYLIEANIGLVREMTAKKLHSEAAQVLTYLDTIAPKEQMEKLRQELAQASSSDQTPSSVPQQSSVKVPTVAAIEELANELAAGAKISNSKWSQVDAWVVDSLEKSSPPASASSPAHLQDLEAVRKAMDLVARGLFDEAQNTLRPLSLKSVLQHWKTFLRSVIFTHQGERDKALRGFGAVEVSAVLSRASAPYMRLLQAPPQSGNLPTEESLAFGLLALSDSDPSWAGSVVKAHKHWEGQDAAKAYSALRGNSKGNFPTVAENLAGAMTDLLFCTGVLNADNRDRLLAMVMSQHPQVANRPKEELALLRFVMLNVDFIDDGQVQRLFTRYMHLLQKNEGLAEGTEAVGRTWLAEKFASETTLPLLFVGKRQSECSARDPQAAKAEFERAIRLAPGRIRPYFGLCRLLDQLKEKAARNKMLDEMARRFPEDKTVLVLVGREALERKSYSKGLVVLEKALLLDPLDGELLDDIVLARAFQILTKSKKPEDKKVDSESWAAIEPLQVDSSKVQCRSRWCLRIIQSLSLPPAEAANAREEGWQLAPHPLVACYFERLVCLTTKLELPPDTERRWFQDLHRASYETIVNLLEVYDYWMVLRKSPCRDQQARMPVEDALEELVTKRRDPKTALILANALVSNILKRAPDDSFRLFCDKLVFEFYNQIEEEGTKLKADPRLRLAVALLDSLRWYESSMYDPMLFLETLVRDAEKAKLPQVVAQAAKLLRTVQTQMTPVDPSLEGDGDDVYDDYFEGILPSGARPSPEEMKIMFGIIMQIKHFSPKELKGFRKDLVGKGLMDAKMFDSLEDLARTTSMEELAIVFSDLLGPGGPPLVDFPPPPSPPPLPRGARRTGSNPDQLDLF